MLKGHISRPNLLDTPKPEIVSAVITNTYTRSVDGATICECQDSKGNLYYDVMVITPFLSDKSTSMMIPIRSGMDVLLLKTSISDPVYIIGSVYTNAEDRAQQTVRFSSDFSDKATLSSGDYKIENGGNLLNMTNGQGVILQSNKGVKIQLPSDGFVRISAAGAADDFAINGSELDTFLCDKVDGYLTQMNQKLQQITDVFNKTQEAVESLSTYLTQLSLFFNVQAVECAKPANVVLAPLAPGFASIKASTDTYKTAFDLKTSANQTEIDTYTNLELRDLDTALVDIINCNNPQVILPKN